MIRSAFVILSCYPTFNLVVSTLSFLVTECIQLCGRISKYLKCGICCSIENFVFQKIALDKLSLKVHKMYDKVRDASMLSVKHDIKKGPNLLQALERKSLSFMPNIFYITIQILLLFRVLFSMCG